MRSSLILLGLVAGLGLTVQVGMNAAIRNASGSAGFAALANFCVGIVALLGFLLVTRTPFPNLAALGALPAWVWLGGTMGALYVASATVIGPALGGTMLLALTVLGQLLAALAVDHFGWLGFPQQPISLARIVGVLLLLTGTWLIAKV
ncbi:MAG TPA: DMT family transporter [Steroidobacteraceae bacterium]|nr:DMT family transporter [Steroidobacteraceae bacterium]HRX90437.1 DMT family transporter [Steroidobacteraceae bacterium]